MLSKIFNICGFIIFFISFGLMSSESSSNQTIYDFPIRTLSGEQLKWDDLNGKVILIVNVASKCGFTRQYKGLQSLFEKYKDRGFTVLGVPSNDFGRQEPGSPEEIQSFCQKNYGVTFLMTEKVIAKGDQIHPLFAYLTNNTPLSYGKPGKISWNFSKFLINRSGRLDSRYSSMTGPESGKLIKSLENIL